MRRILMLLLLMLASAELNASYYDTAYLKGLLDNCSALGDTFEANSENFVAVKDCGLSTGYILGVIDESGIINDRSLCFPRSVESEDIIVAVKGWIGQRPERMHEPAEESVVLAVRYAWACSGA